MKKIEPLEKVAVDNWPTMAGKLNEVIEAVNSMLQSRPKFMKGDKYWWVGGYDVYIGYWAETDTDQRLAAMNNVFLTRAEAEEAQFKFKELLKSL